MQATRVPEGKRRICQRGARRRGVCSRTVIQPGDLHPSYRYGSVMDQLRAIGDDCWGHLRVEISHGADDTDARVLNGMMHNDPGILLYSGSKR